jgi:hypothetical protein
MQMFKGAKSSKLFKYFFFGLNRRLRGNGLSQYFPKNAFHSNLSTSHYRVYLRFDEILLSHWYHISGKVGRTGALSVVIFLEILLL